MECCQPTAAASGEDAANRRLVVADGHLRPFCRFNQSRSLGRDRRCRSESWSSPRPPAFVTTRHRKGIDAITTLGTEHRFAVDGTEDATRFSDEILARYKVVVFLNTTGDVLDAGEKAAFERYIRSGGGLVGIRVELFRRNDGRRPPDRVVSTNRSRAQLVHCNGPHCGILCRAALSAAFVGWDGNRCRRCRRLRALAFTPSRG
jgi:hypothetical protein